MRVEEAPNEQHKSKTDLENMTCTRIFDGHELAAPVWASWTCSKLAWVLSRLKDTVYLVIVPLVDSLQRPERCVALRRDYSVEVSYLAYFILLILVLLSSPVYDDGVTSQPQTIPVPPPCTPPQHTHRHTRACLSGRVSKRHTSRSLGTSFSYYQELPYG